MSEQISLKEIDGMLENQQVDNQADSNVTEETPNETVTFSLADIDAMLDEGEKKPDFAAAKKASDALNGTGSVAKQPTAKTEQKVEQEEGQQAQTQAQGKKTPDGEFDYERGEQQTYQDPRSGKDVATQTRWGKGVVEVEAPYASAVEDYDTGTTHAITPSGQSISQTSTDSRGQIAVDSETTGTYLGSDNMRAIVGWNFPGSSYSRLNLIPQGGIDWVKRNPNAYKEQLAELQGKSVQDAVGMYNKLAKGMDDLARVNPDSDTMARLYAIQEYVHAKDLGYKDNTDMRKDGQRYIYYNSYNGSPEIKALMDSGQRFRVDDYLTKAKIAVQSHPLKSVVDIQGAIGELFTPQDKALAWVTAMDDWKRGEANSIEKEYQRLLAVPLKQLHDEIVDRAADPSTAEYVFRSMGFGNDIVNAVLWAGRKLTGTSDKQGTLDLLREGNQKAQLDKFADNTFLNGAAGGLTMVANWAPAFASGLTTNAVMKGLGMSSGTMARIAGSSMLGKITRGAAFGTVNLPLFTYYDTVFDVFQNPQSGLGDVVSSFFNDETVRHALAEAPTGAVLGPMAVIGEAFGRAVSKGKKYAKYAATTTGFLGESLAFAGSSSIKKAIEQGDLSLQDVWDCTTESVGTLLAMKAGHWGMNGLQGRANTMKNAKGEKVDTEQRKSGADQFGNQGMTEVSAFLYNPRLYAKEHGITDSTDMRSTALGKEWESFLSRYQKGEVKDVDANSVATAMWLIDGKAMLKPISYSTELSADGKTVFSYDSMGNLIEERSFKNKEKAEKWQEELRYDAEKYDMAKLEAEAAQRENEMAMQRTLDTMFDEVADQIPSTLANGEPDPNFNVNTRTEIYNIVANTKSALFILNNAKNLPAELATQYRRMVEVGTPFMERFDQLMAANRQEAEMRSNAANDAMLRDEAMKVLDKKPEKRSAEEQQFLDTYSQILRGKVNETPYVGTAMLDGKQVYVKNAPEEMGNVYYQAEDGSVKVLPAEKFSEFSEIEPILNPMDAAREQLESLALQNREAIEAAKKEAQAKAEAEAQANQQEIEEKKKNAPVIDVQQPAQPEPKVDGSETPSPSTETLQETQVETPEQPEQPKEMSAEEHRKLIDEEQKWLDEHQEADPAEREQHRQRKWASERALGLRDENNNEIVPPPIPGAVEQSPRSATANDEVEKGEPLNESETKSPTAQTERKTEELAPATEETPDMEITNEDLLNTTTLTEEDLADPEAGALKRAARRNAERQRDAAIAYSRGEIKDKPENFDYWKNRLGLEEPKTENAMQPVEEVIPEQQPKETEGAKESELQFGEETSEQREAREKQERVAKAASLRSRHAQLSEEIKQKQLEYRFMNDRKKQYQARQELNKLYDEIEGVEQQLKDTGEPMQVKRFERPAKKERTQHVARKAYDEMRKKYKDDSEVMEILDDTEPQDIYEQIGIALGSSKLLFKSKGEGASRKRGIADETGWKWNDVKGMFQLFDNEKGQSVQNWAETFWADLDEGAKNKYSSVDIANMMLDVLSGASTIGDLRNIVLANRVRQAEELLEHREKEEEYWRDMERHEQEMKDAEEEAMLEHIKDLAENFDEQEYNSKFADEILKEQRDDSTGSNRDLPQGERSGSGNDGRNGEAGERETAGNRDNKDNTSVERPTGEIGADSQEDGRESRGLDSQRVSQERAGLSAKEREIVNRVNAGIDDAISDLDAEIRDLEKKGDDDAAEAARLEKEMLENSREDMIDDALAGYEDLQGFKNGTRAEKQAAERVEKSLADRKAKRMRELLEKLRDPNTSDVRRRAVVRQLADLGVDASGFLEGRDEIKEIEEPGEKDETPKERVIDIKEALDSAESMAKELADMLTDEDYAQFIDWDNGDKEESALMMFDDYWMSPGDPETWAWRNFMYGDNSEPSRYGKAFLEELVKHLDKEIPKAMERAAKAREEQEKAKQEEREKKNKILQPVNDARKNLTDAYKKGDTKTLRQAQKKMAESMISAIEDMVSQFGYEGGTTVEQSIESMKKIRKAAEKGSAEYKTADYIIKALRKFQKDSVKFGQGRVELNAATLKDPVSREYLEQKMEDEGWSEEARKQFMQTLDDAAEVVLEMGKRYKRLGDWNKMEILSETDEVGYNPRWRLMNRKGQWIPNRSAFKKNGEYPWNIDLGTLCTKRESFDALVQLIAEKGMAQNLGPTQIEAIKELLKENDFLTACDICFNETKRARVISYANQISNNWRVVSEAIGVKDKMVGDPIALTQEQRNTLHRMAGRGYKSAFQELIPESERRQYKGEEKSGNEIDLGITASMMQRIAKQMLIDPTLVGKLKPETLITTEGMDWFLRTYGGHTDVNGILASAWGSGTPKPIEGFNLYDPLSWRDDYDQKKENPRWHEGLKSRPSIDWLMNNGGFRAQSFTDYHPMLFLDYLQMFTDVGVRKLPMHIYTKVPALVKLFGGSGAKINMSLVPKMEDGVDAEHAGLKPDGKGGWEYAWDNDSFPIEEAFSLRQDPRFRGNVGIIAVGLSDAHILKMLDDPTIDQVIPYHKSGMPESVQIKTGLKNATDYTDQQTTGGKPKKAADFNFNEAVRRTGDPRKAASEYVKWCEMNGYTPKFEQFKDHPNYYKVLADFRLFDNEGKYSEQEAVNPGKILGDNWKQELENSLNDKTMQEAVKTRVAGNEKLMKDVERLMSKQRMDGAVRDEMVKKLKGALGKDNVESLKQNEFFNALEEAYKQTMGAEQAKAKVEVLRTTNGVVYGFASGGKITLNENVFNAETPIHEFTHIWVKVAQRENAKLWKKGKGLLKQTGEWQEVMNDDLYADIRGDEDAVASEVLARIVGSEGADYVRRLLDPEHKPLKQGGVYNQIKEWLREMFNNVRSLFAPSIRNLTYDEFVNMPLKTLFDEAEAKRFLEAKTRLESEGRLEGDVEGEGVELSVVKDPKEIERLEKEPVEYGYRNVSMKEDGTFRSPMADKLGKKGEKSRSTEPFQMNAWEKSDENPDLATDDGKINLIKPNGLGSVGAVDYNPYIHIRPTTLNKQFKNAWERNDLVYLKVAYPASELDKGYHAPKAKLSVGKHPWNGGELILSRWDKPMEIVPWEEVANEWVNEFKGRGVEFDIVPPKLLPILMERGVEILPPHKGMGKACNDAYQEKVVNRATRYEKMAMGYETSSRNTERRDREYAEAVEKGDTKKAEQMVKAAAKDAGMATDESGKLIDLYHGTNRFGFTVFDRLKSRMGVFFTSNRSNVAANYGGDDHYAGKRKINKGYKQDDSQEGILNNARSVFDQDWNMATEEQKEAIVTKAEADARRIVDEIDKRRVDTTNLPADEELDIFNATAWVEDLFNTVAYAKENGNEGAELYRLVSDGVERYNENKQIVRDYYNKHYDELDAKQRGYLNYLTHWESGDVAIEIEYSYKNILSGKELATVDGNTLITLDRLKEITDEAHNIGSYHLYGNLGENPLIVDADGKNWYSLEYDGRKFDTDTLAQYAKENGYTSLVVKNVYDYGDKADDYIFFDPNQIKSADPVTYDDNGNVIPLSERFNTEKQDIRYRLGDGEKPTFYSNAERAVEGIKQNKATAEQWKAMLTKAGGIKAGEDKWMGLSAWLDENKGKSLTKDEVLQFVRDNGIQMEEVNYGDIYETSGYVKLNDEYMALRNDAERIFQEANKQFADYVGEMEAKYGDDYYRQMTPQERQIYNRLSIDQELRDPNIYSNEDIAFREMVDRYGDDFEMAFRATSAGLEIDDRDAASYFVQDVQAINFTRLDYTTEGLENKREIAFKVPNIEPYQEHDEVHFGPENQGKAVMWVRFGETTDADGNRVLVIDEIQSNRHQDAREKGYKNPDMQKDFETYRQQLEDKYFEGRRPVNFFNLLKRVATPEEVERYKELSNGSNRSGVPDAPFEKNWHEVAMKRMLRLAAEEGFDKVAWTTGEQQAKRYNIGNVVDRIISYDYPSGDKSVKKIEVRLKDGETMPIVVDENGIVVEGRNGIEGKPLSEILGKELSVRIMQGEGKDGTMWDGADRPAKIIEGDGLRIGGEGMKGFYDQMLPRFMDKYGKRWGVKTGTVELPNVEEAGRTMHSIDVTPEMKESVMQGQPLFRLSDSRFSDDKEFEQAVKEYNDTLRMNERRANRQGADYYPTPAPLALVASRLLHAEKGMDVLDIGSGSGMLHKYIKEGNVTAVEASPELAEANRKNTDANVVTGDFMEVEDGKKYDRIITNPPYGQKGAEAFRHATKGYESLADGGRMVAILPMGRNADRLYNEFVEKVKADGGRVTADVELPSCTFYKAGVHGSRTRMIVVDKNAEGETEKVNLGGITTNQGLYEAIYKMDVSADGKVTGVDLSDASHRIGFSRPRTEEHIAQVTESVERVNKQIGGNAKVVREAELGKDVPKNAQAWYDPNTGEVHVVAERVNGAEDASRAVWHEEIGHKAMSELLGDRYNEWLDDVHKLLGSEHADAMQRLREKYAKELDGKSEEAQNRLLADEWIAELAERGEKDLSTWQKVKGMFRNWLWKHFGVMLGDGDIDYMLHKALAERRKGYRSKAMMSIAERRRAEEGNAMAEQSRRYRLLDEENRAEAKSRARDLLEAERDELNDKKTQMEDALNRALTVRRGDPSAENLAMSPKQRRELAASIERLEKRIDALNDSLAETDLTDPERVVNRAWDHVGLSTEAEMLMQKAESLMKTKDILRNAGVTSVENLTPEQRKEYDRYLWNGKIADARLTAMRDARPERPFEGSIDDNLGREPQYDDFRHPDLDRDDLSERDRDYLERQANDNYSRAKAEWNRKKERLIEQLDDYEAECDDWRMRQRDYMREIVDAEKKLRADWQTDYWSAMENNQEADALLHVADMTGIPLTSKHDVQTYLRELRYEHVRRQQHAEGEDYKFIKEIESMVDKAVGTGSLANKVRKHGDRKQVMRDLIDMMEGTKEVTEEMKPIVKKIQQWFDDMFEWQVASGLVYAPWKYRQGYVPHLWNIDASRPDADAAAKIEKAGGLVPTRMNSPFMNERFYDTYEEGIQHGLVPKHESIIDLIKEYSKEVNKAVSNRQALDILRFVKAPIETEVWVEQEGGGKEKVKQTQWLPIVIDAGEVPPKGVQYNAYKNSAFYKDGTPQFLILSPRYVKGTERNIYSMFGEQGYVSSKDAADSGLEKALGAADKASQMVKQTNLMFSAFHGIALTEHMLGSSRNPLRVIKQALYDTIIESVVTGKTLRMRKGDVAEDAMSHFVKLGNSYDFGRSMDVLTKLSDMINNPDNPEWRKFVNAKNDKERAKAAKALIRGTFGTPFKLLKLLKKGNDFILWDMLHDGYKLSVWDLRSRKLREKAEKKGWSEAELNRRLDDLGQTINDMFGGQHWELLNASPRMMRNLRLAFLSPDWNASWMRLWGRMAGMGKLRNDNFFRGLKNEEGNWQSPISGKAIKKAWKENNAQGLAFTVMLVSGIMAHIGYSLMNLAMRKKDIEEELAKAEEIRKTDPNYKSPYEEEGITPITWENFLGRANEWILSPWNSLSDPGRGTYVYVGRDANGVSRYIRPGKQMRELFELFLDSEDHLDLGAWYKAGMRKANPFAQMIHEAGTGYSLTGWENKKLTQTYGAERELNRLKYMLLHSVVPLSIVDPIEKSDTEKMGWRMAYPVSKGMTWYRGNKLLEEAIANDDSKMVEHIRRSFVLNGMGEDFEKAYTSSLSKVRRNAAKAEGYEDKTPDELFKMAAKSNDPKMRKKYVDKATEKLESAEEKEGKTAREAMDEYQQKTQKEGNYLLHCTEQDMEYDANMKIFMKKAEEDGSVVATFRKMGGTIPKKTQVKKGKKVVDSRIEWKGKDGYTNADCEKFYKEHEDELIAYYRMNMFREGYNARIKEMKDLKGKEADAKMKEIREYRNKWMQYASEYLDTTTWKVKKHKK